MLAKANSTDSKDKVQQGSSEVLPIREEKRVIKVAVLTEPYFPKQKLSIKFNSVVMKHMEMDNHENTYRPPGTLNGQIFGIVQKMDKSYRSFAKYGTICEIVGESSMTLITNS